MEQRFGNYGMELMSERLVNKTITYTQFAVI